MVKTPLLIALVCKPSVSDPRSMCTCVTGRQSVKTQVRAALGRADAVFAGSVVSIRDSLAPFFPDTPRSSVRFRRVVFVRELSWKGPATDSLVVWTGSGNGDCGYQFEVGARYLVVAVRHDSTSFSTGICSLTQAFAGAQEYAFPILQARAHSKRLPNKRLKLAGGDRFKGSGVLCPWRGTDFVPRPCAGGRVARSLSAIR